MPSTRPAAPLIRSAALDRPGVAHGFTTREGGVSVGPLASLNLRRRPGETPEALTENWARVLAALDERLEVGSVALLSQVHGNAVVRVGAGAGPLAAVAEADGAITTEPGVVLVVGVADCVPVLVASPGGVAVAHAGWRGTVAGVVPATIAALAEATGDDPAAMTAAIGPHISAEVYEVGPEVVAGLESAGLDLDRVTRPGQRGRPHADLGAAVAEQLRRSGVGTVDRLGLCTVRDPRFFSHRRDGEGAGRFSGVITRTGSLR
jgi:YfiH family protein